MQSLEPWLKTDEVTVHDFGEQVLLPGLINPHLHPVMAAVLLPMHFITALEWQLPGRVAPACPDRDSYFTRLRELEAAMPEDEADVSFADFDAPKRPYTAPVDEDQTRTEALLPSS